MLFSFYSGKFFFTRSLHPKNKSARNLRPSKSFCHLFPHVICAQKKCTRLKPKTKEAIYAPFRTRPTFSSVQVSRQSIRSRMGTVVNELIRNARVCKMYAAEDHKVGEYFEEAQEMVKLQTKNARVQASSGLVESLIPHIISMGMFVYAASLVLAGKMTYPEMMLVGMYQDTLSEAFGELPGVVVSYGNMTGQNKKVFQILERKPKMRARGDGRADAVRVCTILPGAGIAQSVEQRTGNPCVTSSNLVPATSSNKFSSNFINVLSSFILISI